MFARLREDIKAVKERDPAASSAPGILLNYPGVQAVSAHRFQHALWRCGRRGLARFLSQCTRFFTGIEIHPGATLGRRVFIDHGMGVIIGETAVVGNDVTIFQGVTLGGTGKETGKRHPNVADGAIIGVGAAVLGNVTIGARSKVGGGAVVVDNVPDDATVVGIPGRVVAQNGIRVCPADPFRREPLPDPFKEELMDLAKRVEELERELEREVAHEVERELEHEGISHVAGASRTAGALGDLSGASDEQLAELSRRLDELEAELNALDERVGQLNQRLSNSGW